MLVIALEDDRSCSSADDVQFWERMEIIGAGMCENLRSAMNIGTITKRDRASNDN